MSAAKGKSMSQEQKKTGRKPRVSIRRDPMNPSDYLNYQFRFSCEDCTHFKASDATCTLGYWPQWHRKAFQTEEYERTGKMALCRFLEID
jgi:hypothetical protein